MLEINNKKHHFFRCAGTKLTASILLITALILTVSVFISLLCVRYQFDTLVHSQFESVLHAHENFMEQSLATNLRRDSFHNLFTEIMRRKPV